MYVVSNNIKILSLLLVVLGLLGIGYGFYSSPKTIEESKEMIASMGHDSHSHDSHSSNDEKSYSSDHDSDHGHVTVSYTHLRAHET